MVSRVRKHWGYKPLNWQQILGIEDYIGKIIDNTTKHKSLIFPSD